MHQNQEMEIQNWDFTVSLDLCEMEKYLGKDVREWHAGMHSCKYRAQCCGFPRSKFQKYDIFEICFTFFFLHS
jgi:hypothetical protein